MRLEGVRGVLGFSDGRTTVHPEADRKEML
jgi:hypothetical protein